MTTTMTPYQEYIGNRAATLATWMIKVGESTGLKLWHDTLTS